MNINILSNSPSFGSIYKFQVDDKNIERINSIEKKLHKPEIKDGKNYKVFTDFFTDFLETGIYKKVHISARDSYDKRIESLLKQKNIKFEKASKSDALKLENIFNRIVLSGKLKDKTLVTLDTKKVDKLFSENKNFYISPYGKTGTIGKRYQNFLEYLETGRNIDAAQIILKEDNGVPKLTIYDGRHRYAVMRDIGMKKINFALDAESFALAQKYGLVANS